MNHTNDHTGRATGDQSDLGDPRTPQPGPRPARPHRPFPPRLGPSHSPAWERETSKCIGREVTVTQYVGVNATGAPLFIDHVGVCVALQYTHLSVILMTDTEKLIIKNVAAIRRKRTKDNPAAPHADNPAAPHAEPEVTATTLTKATSELAGVLGDALKGAPE